MTAASEFATHIFCGSIFRIDAIYCERTDTLYLTSPGASIQMTASIAGNDTHHRKMRKFTRCARIERRRETTLRRVAFMRHNRYIQSEYKLD